ncbi:MAG: helix-turn-helix domain-containing protein [Planctomycetota bacterium]
MGWYGWRPYVPVAERRARAQRELAKLRKKGLDIQPVEIEGRKIARTFWGDAWCEHLESFSDYSNRLPRGRTYVRNGSVCHLEIAEGEVRALVSGSELYEVAVAIDCLAAEQWRAIKGRCAGRIGSLIELLAGRLSENVMAVVTDREAGLFPLPGEITFECSCPDWAVMCKHVAAVLYGVGARLDEEPGLLFRLRGVRHEELIGTETGAAAVMTGGGDGTGRRRIADDAVADVFGIEMTEDTSTGAGPAEPPPKVAKETAAPKETHAAASRRGKRGKNGAGGTARRPNSGSSTRPQAAGRAAGFTAQDIAEMRAELGMSRSEFARFLGVSDATIGNWERKSGPLNLQTRTFRVLAAARDALPKAPDPFTGREVAELRTRFGMSKAQFARLLGVSDASVGNWERRPGQLNLQTRTFEALDAVRDLTPAEARRRLDRP